MKCRYCSEETEKDGLCDNCSNRFDLISQELSEKENKIKNKIKVLRKENQNKKANKRRKRYYDNRPFVRLTQSILKRGKEKKSDVTPFKLWRIAKKQKNICPISGDKLTNKNISPDHIISLFHGGSNNVENIQLVTKQVNISKYTMSCKEFILLCKKITDFNTN